MNLSQPVKQPQKTSTTPDAEKPLSINPRKIARSLIYVTLFLTIVYIISGILEKMAGVESIVTKSLYYAFDMDGEDNIPSAFSFIILVLSAILLIVIGNSTSIKKHRKFWFLLSFIFLFLACDEFMQIHEKLGMYLKDSRESAEVQISSGCCHMELLHWPSASSLSVLCCSFPGKQETYFSLLDFYTFSLHSLLIMSRGSFKSRVCQRLIIKC